MSVFTRRRIHRSHRQQHPPAGPDSADSPLLTRADPPEAGRFRDSEILGDYALLRWDTAYGTVGLGYSLVSGNGDPHALVDALWCRHVGYLSHHYAAVVVGQMYWNVESPQLDAIDIAPGGRLSAPYRPSWQQLATVLGTRAPWWHSALRDREAILAWSPGVPPAVVPAGEVEMPTGVLTALAADEPDGSPAAEVCLWLARRLRHTATRTAADYLVDLTDEVRGDGRWVALGAVPAELHRPAPEPLPPDVRREGWARVVCRPDALAVRVAHLVGHPDGEGWDWPAGAVTEVRPDRCATAARWAARLTPVAVEVPPTGLEADLLRLVGRAHPATLLHDPDTGLPAVRREFHLGGEQIFTAVPSRLPTTGRLSAVTLSGTTVWVHTDDGGLWIAPRHPGHGLSWGYPGGGPTALAVLLDRLLDDASGGAVDGYDPEPPPRLEQLVEDTPREGSVTYTRQHLDRVRRRS
jgi:hypothetical protein